MSGVYGSFNINLDGAKAASEMLGVSANNVARSNVPKAMPDRVGFQDIKHGGVEAVRVERLEAREDELKVMEMTGTSGVDLAQEAIYQIVGSNTFGANIEMAKSGLSLYSHILNIHV